MLSPGQWRAFQRLTLRSNYSFQAFLNAHFQVSAFLNTAPTQPRMTKVTVTLALTVTTAPSPKWTLHISHIVSINLMERRRHVAPSGLVFSLLTVSAFTTFETPSPLHFIFNQSGCEALPGCCSNVTHPAGEISNPRADTPSLELLLPRTECALHHSWDIICCRRRLRLLHHLMKIPSLFGVTLLSALSVATELQKSELIRKWTLIFLFFFLPLSKFLIIFLYIVLLQQET